jgi:hypothetical protein
MTHETKRSRSFKETHQHTIVFTNKQDFMYIPEKKGQFDDCMPRLIKLVSERYW